MNFIYKNAKYPANQSLLKKLNSSAQQIYDTLKAAGPAAPTMDEFYRDRYYKTDLDLIKGKLTNCVYHIIWAMEKIHKPLEEITMIEHGGGLGMIGMVAKKAGIGQVIYNDIDQKFLDAARGIARIADALSDHYLVGDIGPFIEQMDEFRPNVDMLISYDVLEHIYDLDAFFETLCSSKYCPNVILSSSGANMFSPEYVMTVRPIQAREERKNKQKRMVLIKNVAPELTEDEIIKLGNKTRLLVNSEITALVNYYKKDKLIRFPLKSGANAYDPYNTNTVDPDNGWWAEHLVNPFYLSRYLKKYGYNSRIMAGFHNGERRSILLNPIIKILGERLSLPFAGYYTVYAYKDGF